MPTLLTLSDIKEQINGEPRILDIRLAEALGLERPINIRLMIQRNMTMLERFWPLFSQKRVINGGEAVEYYLTEKQALFLCTKSKAEKAMEATIQMVEVFYAHRHRLTEPLPHNQAIKDRQALEEPKETVIPEAERITATQATKRMEKTHGDILKASEVMAHLATGKRTLPPELMEWLARELLRKITLSCACMEILTARIR